MCVGLSDGSVVSQSLFAFWLVIEDHDNLFVMAEIVHFMGIGLLAWKLLKKQNAGGERSGHCTWTWRLCMQQHNLAGIPPATLAPSARPPPDGQTPRIS